MSDSFNAHDILAKLRAKSVSNVGENLAPPSDSKQRPSNNPIMKQSPSTKVIKGPSALTLTPSQVLLHKFRIISLKLFSDRGKTI